MRKYLVKTPLVGGFFEQKKPVVPVLRLSGVITPRINPYGESISYEGLSKQIERAFTTYGAKAVAITVNSPGGAAVQSAMIAGRIRELAQEHDLPVYTFIEDVAASGGYWLACAGDKIYAWESSIVGSIGVISAGFGLNRFIAEHKIERRVYTAGKNKSFNDPFMPEDKDDVARLKTLQQDIHENFKNWVRERRGDTLKTRSKGLFEGEFWAGEKAAEIGLIDGIGSLRRVMRDEFGDDTVFKKIDVSRSFLSSIFMTKKASSTLNFNAESLVEIVDAVENRTMWSRYGL